MSRAGEPPSCHYRQRFCPSKIVPGKDVFLRARPGALSLISVRIDDFAPAGVFGNWVIDVPPGLLAIGDQMIQLAIAGPSRAAMGKNRHASQ
jgi:hypothetical protein